MISGIRKQIESRDLKGTLGLAILLSLVGSALVPIFSARKQSGENVVMTVNGENVSGQEYQRKLVQNYQLKEMIKQQYGNLADFILKYYGLEGNIEQVTIDGIVKEKIFQNIASKLNVEVGTDYLDKNLSELIYLIQANNPQLIPNDAILANGNINVSYLDEHLKRIGITPDQFDEQVKEMLKKELVSKLISQSIAVPEQMIKDLYIQKSVPRTYKVIKADFDNYLKKVKDETIFESEIADYYKKHLEEYRIPEKRNATVWEFNFENFDIKVNDKEISNYYEKNKEDFKSENKDKVSYKSLQEVKLDIENIIKRQKFIRAFSLQSSKLLSKANKNSSDLDSFIKEKKATKSQLDGVEHDGGLQSNKVFSINKIGGYTFYTQDSKGFIVKLDNIDKSFIQDLEKVEDKVKNSIYNQRAKELLKSNLKQAYEEVQKGLSGNSLIMDQVSQNLEGKVELVELDPKDQKNIDKLRKDEFPVDAMLNLTIPNSVYFVQSKNGYLILLDKIKEFDLKDIESHKKDLLDQANANMESAISNAFVASLQKNAKIKYIGLTKKK